MKETLLISACLTGVCCKYDGGSNALPAETLAALREHYELIAICPETEGGLPVPRTPCERAGGRVISRDGRDLTAAYEKGARLALARAERFGCRRALLKERSPSCGADLIYDGTFSRVCVPGDGVTAELLRGAGLFLCGESEVGRLIKKRE